jgi:hypothetical protein
MALFGEWRLAVNYMNKFTAILGLILLLAATQVYSDCGIISGPYPPPSVAGQPIVAGIMNPINSPMTHANMNGVMNPLTFPGTDFGVKVNEAMAAMPGGGIIQIPAGIYSTGTTIQCPIGTTGSGQPTFIFQGAGMQSPWSPTQAIPLGTIINYTGSGDLFNQVEPGAMSQNATGCKLRDMTLNGGMATGPNAVGYHFGGTDDAEVMNVRIQSFAKAGIEIDNENSLWTERWRLGGTTSFAYNGVAIWAHRGTGSSIGDPSIEHSYMNVWLNVGTGEVGVLMDGGVDNVNSDWTLTGNIDGSTAGVPSGTAPGGTLVKVATQSWFAANLTDMTECQASTTCTRFNIDAAIHRCNCDRCYLLSGIQYLICWPTNTRSYWHQQLYSPNSYCLRYGCNDRPTFVRYSRHVYYGHRNINLYY